MQRTDQRRSFAQLKSQTLAAPQFEPQVVAKVRADFSAKVLQKAPIEAVLMSHAGTVLSINQYAIGLFGQSEAQVLGAPLPDLFPVALRAEVHQFLRADYRQEPKRTA